MRYVQNSSSRLYIPERLGRRSLLKTASTFLIGGAVLGITSSLERTVYAEDEDTANPDPNKKNPPADESESKGKKDSKLEKRIKEEIDAAVKKLNEYRNIAGLKEVVLDEKLSKGCFLHADYLKINNKVEHDEDPKLPGYSLDGNIAGLSSVITTEQPTKAIDVFMETYYHRLPLLHPGLTKVGFGYVPEYSVVRIDNVKNWENWKNHPPILYPVENQKNVGLSLHQERPKPTPTGKGGYPITVSIYGGSPSQVTAKLLEEGKKEVEIWLDTPEAPLNPIFPTNHIGIIAKKPLKPNKKYTVKVKALIGDLVKRIWEKTWSFETGHE